MKDKKSVDARVEAVFAFCRSCVADGVGVEPDPGMSLGEGELDKSGGKATMRIGIGRRAGWRRWSDEELLVFCVTAGHELRHLEQRGLAKFAGAAGMLPMTKDVCCSYWACMHNQVWYRARNKKTALCEVDAEHGGLVYGEYMAQAYCGMTDTEAAVVAYCNRQVESGFLAEVTCRNASERLGAGYYLKPEDCGGKRLASIDDVDKAFEQAEIRAKACRSLYKARYGRDDTYPFGDEFFDIMRRGRTIGDDCFDKFIKANRIVDDRGGHDLVDAMACLVLYLHPEESSLSPVDLSDLTAEAVFGSPFSEVPAEMIAYRDYVCKHDIGIVNTGEPLNRYSDDSGLTGRSEQKTMRKRLARVRDAENAFGSVVSGPGGGLSGGPPGPGE